MNSTNERINKFLLVGDKFMPEMHLRQPRFVYSACGPFTRHKERIKEFKRTGNINLLYKMFWIKLVLNMMQHMQNIKM